MRDKKEKVIIFFIGLFSVILLLEVGLRIAGSIHKKITASDQVSLKGGRQNSYIILCLGDSHTEGIGATRDKSYPKQLEGLLNSKVRGRTFTVINRGLGGYNTAQLLNELQYNIDSTKPDLIILLIGEANRWNYWGYYAYSKGRNLFSILNDYLYRIRVYKLIKLLFLNVKDRIKQKLSYNKIWFDITDVWADGDQRTYYKERIRRLKKAIKENPDNSFTYYNMGMVYKEQENYPEAVRWLKKGMELDSDDVSIYIALGEVYKDQGNYEEAIKWLKKAVEMDQSNSSLYHCIGVCYRNQGNYEEAIKWLKKAVEMDQSNSSVYSCIGDCYRNQGNYEEAIKWFKEAVEMEPSNSSTYSSIGYCYSKGGNYEEALRWFKEGVRVDPDNYFNYGGIAEIYRETYGFTGREYSELVEFLRRTAKNSPAALNYIEMFSKKNAIEEIYNWARSDIGKIIKICQSQGIKIILHNYPINWWANIHLKLEKIARKYSIPFVDNERAFEVLWLRRQRREDYFIPDGHCNEKGYAIMAKNIYNKMMKLNMFDLGDDD